MPGMTMTEKILARAAGLKVVKPGDRVKVNVNVAQIHDVTGPPTIETFYEKYGKDAKVWDKKKIVVTPDHFVPSKDIASAEQCQILEKFVREQGIPSENYYPVGANYGVCHIMLLQEGHALPGTVIFVTDSHGCTGGAIGAFAQGIGHSKMADIFATGLETVVVPPTIKFVINGRLPPNVMAKDIILRIVGDLGADGARGHAVEFCGTAIERMSMDERMTLTNMVIEIEATNGIIAPDRKTLKYLKRRAKGSFELVYSNPDAEYAAIFEYNASKIVPMVAAPFRVDNVTYACNLRDVKINQAVIVGCTGGKLDDLYAAAMVLVASGKKVADGVRMIVIPATQKIYKEALKLGLISIFLEAGAIIGPPSCGPCLGGHLGVLGRKEICITSSNRNFRTRMGHETSEVYLASPMTVAKSAIEGYIHPYDLKHSRPFVEKPYIIIYDNRVKVDDTPPLSKEVLSRELKGKAYVIPEDSVDTDVMIPARYLTSTDPEFLGLHALEGLDPNKYPRFVNEDGTCDFKIIIAGKDFGCGSSREHAPIALYRNGKGALAVIARSFARIFLQNAIKGETIIPLEIEEDITREIETGDEVEIDTNEWKLINHTTGKTYALKKPKIEVGEKSPTVVQ